MKDNICTGRLKTTGGSRSYGGSIPNRDAHSVKLLRAAGAIIIGKTNIGFGPLAHNLHFGQIRNPWGLGASPGASSSGSAAAVAAQLVPASLGTDTGGSIRVPSGFCGVVGLKPSKGLVSTDGVVPTVSCPSLDQVGVIARSVEDASRVLHAMSGTDTKDPFTFLVPRNHDPAAHDIKGARVGIPKPGTFWPQGTDHDVERNFFDAVDVLRELGASVSEIPLPRIEEVREKYKVIAEAERAAIYASEDPALHPGGEPYVSRAKRGMSISATSYLQAQGARKEFSRVYDRALQSLDALVTPAVLCVAPKSARSVSSARLETMDLTAFTSPFNLTGQPAISIPNGFGPGQLPTGFQLAGRFGRDDAVLAIAGSYERATVWHKRHPPS